MPSQKISSQTSRFEVFDSIGSPSEYISVGGVTSIRDLRSGTAAEIDVTDLSSTEKEYLLGLADPGSMSLDVIYDPMDRGQTRLELLRVTSDAEDFRVVIPNPGLGSPPWTYFTFSGRVQTFPFNLAVDAAMTGSVTIRITGAISKAAA